MTYGKKGAALLGVVAALALALPGCGGGGNDGTGGGGGSLPEGTWLMVSRTVDGTADAGMLADVVAFGSDGSFQTVDSELRWPTLGSDRGTASVSNDTVTLSVAQQAYDDNGNGQIDAGEWQAAPSTSSATFAVSGSTMTVDTTDEGRAIHMVFERVPTSGPAGLWRVASRTSNGAAVAVSGLMRIRSDNTFARVESRPGSPVSGASGSLAFGAGSALTVTLVQGAQDANSDNEIESGEWSAMPGSLAMTYTMPDNDHINLTWTEEGETRTESLERVP